ncbi:glycosyltransferase family 2 protein [Salinisphaera aquimarina]|uniref:Glycosyltransferase family 2 protein n=1 Tax=Salinisphaera aquimarina TaxID=2094031 RepID=A0ABV7EU79_9GAMM
MPDQPISLSVVVPFYNEQGNVAPLLDEIHDLLAGRHVLEIVAVDDGSSDATMTELRAVQTRMPALTVFMHARNSGQSSALATGIRGARASLIATLDGDGQNPPAAIPSLLAAHAAHAAHATDRVLVVGRRQRRRDNRLRRLSSRVANGVRRRLLRDGCDDTGCGLKVFDRALFLGLPGFDHMHRFLPALAARSGARVINVDVAHRERAHGHSKYGVGNRLWVGIVDMLGVLWLQTRPLVAADDVREHRGS